jgi:hypothetical protein
VKLVTGNDLASGDVVWWTGARWSRHIEEAIDVAGEGEAIAAREEASLRVNVPYVIDAAAGPTGPVPLHIKDRIRAFGPSVRPDLGVPPLGEKAAEWVI